MSRLRISSHAPDRDGTVLLVTPEIAGWHHVGLRIVRLETGGVHDGGETGREACLVILSGIVEAVVGERRFAGLGQRRTVFEGPPTSLYLPAGRPYRLIATTQVEIAICTAPGTDRHPPRIITPSDVIVSERGEGTNQRHIRDILPETAAADSLLVVEVITPGGHWSSYPPHKHDTDTPPDESQLEETYYHRLAPPTGFAMQRVYDGTGALDEIVAVEDGDVVLVPRGYHPVAAPPGHMLYYLNVMAGPHRLWRVRYHPHDRAIEG